MNGRQRDAEQTAQFLATQLTEATTGLAKVRHMLSKANADTWNGYAQQAEQICVDTLSRINRAKRQRDEREATT